MPLDHSVNAVGNILYCTLETGKDYQKQLFIVPPRTRIPTHSHHNVRTNIIYLSGHMIFEKGHRTMELLAPQDSHRSFVIEPDEEHGAWTLEDCGIFISEQYWLDNEQVKSLHLNWTGKPLNIEHERELAK